MQIGLCRQRHVKHLIIVISSLQTQQFYKYYSNWLIVCDRTSTVDQHSYILMIIECINRSFCVSSIIDELVPLLSQLSACDQIKHSSFRRLNEPLVSIANDSRLITHASGAEGAFRFHTNVFRTVAPIRSFDKPTYYCCYDNRCN